MKNKMALMLAAAVISLMTATSVSADKGEHGGGAHLQTTTTAESSAEVSAEDTQSDDEATVQAGAAADTDQPEADDNEQDGGSDKQHKDGHGLLNALEHVKGTPAEERITTLLKEKYNIDVQADASVDVDTLTDQLVADGELEAAEDIQAAVVQDDVTDLDGYKKLSKIKDKRGDKGIKAYVNGVTPKFDVPPVAKEGRVLVPFRAIAEALNAEVSWDAATKTVTVTRDGIEVKLQLGSKTAYVNGVEVTLDVPGQTKNNRVIVPLRFLSEALKATVNWDQETSSVIVVDETQTASDSAAASSTTDASSATSTSTTTDASSATSTSTTTDASGTTSTSTTTDASGTTSTSTTTDASSATTAS